MGKSCVVGFCLFLSSVFFQSFLETEHNSMDWEHPIFSLQSWIFWGDLPVQQVCEWETRQPKASLQLSFTSAVQSRNCPGRKPTPWVLWHFPPSDSDTFFHAFSKGQSTSDRHQCSQHCPSDQTQQRPRSKDTLGKRLWGISGNYENRNGQQTEQKISPQADKALGSCPACNRTVDPYRMQSAPGGAGFCFSCLFGQIMETGIKDIDSQSWAVS